MFSCIGFQYHLHRTGQHNEPQIKPYLDLQFNISSISARKHQIKSLTLNSC